MTAFLILNSYTVPLAYAVAQERTLRPRGQRRMSANGIERAARFQSGLRQWKCRTKPIHYSKLWALSQLIVGNAHVWSFQNANLWSSGGAGVQRGYSNTIRAQYASGPFSDAHRLYVPSSANIALRAQLRDGKQWWAQCVESLDGTTWRRTLFLDDASVYQAGVLVGSAFWGSNTFTGQWFFPSGSTPYDLSLFGRDDGNANHDHYFAEVVVGRGWRPTSDMITTWAARTTRWPAMPVLEMKGQGQAESSINVIGDIGDSPLVSAMINGEFSGTHGQLDFTLYEQPVLA